MTGYFKKYINSFAGYTIPTKIVHVARNVQFCFSFQAWTKELCQKDSDGDGKKNGEELGDPDCEWTPNSVAKSTQGLSHPGNLGLSKHYRIFSFSVING